jgi:urate oxidase
VGIVLGPNRFGKAETRVVRVTRHGDRHELADLNVSVALSGDLAGTHLTGDNANVLTTDAQKNTVYALARDGVRPVEEFALRLARHFVDSQPAIHRARVHVERYGWDRLGPHSFARSGGEVRTATVAYARAAESGGHSSEQGGCAVSGLTGLVLLNSTDSEFRGYVVDRYTTLPETSDRILATSVTAQWRHTSAMLDADWAKSYAEARRLLVEAFVDTYSKSLQQTLFAMGRRVLEGRGELAEIRFALPNKHHLLVDLSPFGLDNPNEVFHADDRPYGLIEGTVLREGAPDGGAWEDLWSS